MDFYSIFIVFVRLFLVLQFWPMAAPALKSQTRDMGSIVFLANAVSLLLGFFVYPFTTVLLVLLGIRIWQKRKRGVRFGRDLFLFFLTMLIFVKGPGVISLDKLIGNI